MQARELNLAAGEPAPFTLEDLNVRGRILAPGTLGLRADGQPARVHISRDVILEAYDELRKHLAAQGVVDMQLAHPGVGDMPLEWGRALDFLVNRDAGEVYLAASEPTSEMRKTLTQEAIMKLASLGLSFRGPSMASKRADGSWDITRLRIRGVDIVGRGSVPGSNIARTLPLGLAAMLAQLPNDREAAGSPNASQRSASEQPQHGENTMDVPETELKDLRAQAAEVPKLTDQLKELRAQLETKTKDATANEAAVKELSARMATMGEQVKTLAAQATKAHEEKELLLAAQDVDKGIVQGKLDPAARDEMLAFRKTAPDQFKTYLAKAKVMNHPGEKGAAGAGAGDKPEPTTTEKGATEAIDIAGGPAAYMRSRMPISEPVARALVAQYADVPEVKARLPELRTRAGIKPQAGGA